MIISKLRVYNSPVEGRGIVVAEPIKKGEVVIIFEGQEISSELAEDIYSSGSDYLLQISEDSFLHLPGPEKFVNHSCSPSCAFLNNNGELVALRDLNVGDEITFDYSANQNTHFSLSCLCGSKQCRKTIVPFNSLSIDEKKALESILSPYLKLKQKSVAIY